MRKSSRLLLTLNQGGGYSGYASIVNHDILPAWVDGWQTNQFGSILNIPNGSSIPTDSQGQLQLDFTVSGTAGGTTLTISAGDETKGTDNWAGVVQHDDGTYGHYRISGVGGGDCVVFPALRANVTSKTLRNAGGGSGGVHPTEPSLRALAHRIYATTLKDGYRNRYAAKWDSFTGAALDWTNVGGLGGAQYAMQTPNNYISASVAAASMLTSRGRTAIYGTPTTPFDGKGLSKTFSIGGATGFLELFVSAASTTGNGFRPYRVQVVADGSTTLLDTTYTANDGLQRLIVDLDGSHSSVAITVTATGDALWTGTSGSIIIGDVTFWKYDRNLTWSSKAIDKNGKTVVIGDSWTTYYSAALGDELQDLITADGGSGTVVSVGEGGRAVAFGLANFDALVVPENPDTVVIAYSATNDWNQGLTCARAQDCC